jgi:hypothetical protein
MFISTSGGAQMDTGGYQGRTVELTEEEMDKVKDADLK